MKKLITIISFLLPLVACAQTEPHEHPNNQQLTASELYQQIEQELADNSCNDDNDCELVGVGTMPCGGPEVYLPYAKNNVDIDKLTALVEQHSEQQKQYYQDNQIMGICVVTPVPAIACRNNRCEASQQSLQIQ